MSLFVTYFSEACISFNRFSFLVVGEMGALGTLSDNKLSKDMAKPNPPPKYPLWQMEYETPDSLKQTLQQ